MNRHFEKLVSLFSGLPGIGPRHATRIVLSLLGTPDRELGEFAAAIRDLPQNIRLCRECFNVSGRERCPICIDSARSRAVMVVERISDLQAMERSGLWDGRYHVLGGSIDPADSGTLRIPELMERARSLVGGDTMGELVLATGTDAAGETTAMYLQRELSAVPGLKVTRLARGLSTGARLEYADELTLKHALESRK